MKIKLEPLTHWPILLLQQFEFRKFFYIYTYNTLLKSSWIASCFALREGGKRRVKTAGLAAVSASEAALAVPRFSPGDE